VILLSELAFSNAAKLFYYIYTTSHHIIWHYPWCSVLDSFQLISFPVKDLVGALVKEWLWFSWCRRLWSSVAVLCFIDLVNGAYPALLKMKI